ncbi:nucleotidyltransferase family protein [Hufsiella ginkgonis]|uniref:NTP transferase domain-containing protein n=1 Tax=Hufsiella ginkgonis TaxID=2695274 RepID=A0A7K1XYM0_9SPHI|nr:nucleotidyltransferase family protein [Hufsiella ginkgonis]MXV16070.1 NTP transferase domain-containing protein [Hufsiella ginkgonis]
MKTGIVILAAGDSSRLGSPKQLLGIRDTTLLNHTVAVAAGLKEAALALVLGAFADQLLPRIAVSRAIIVHNNGWEEGIASSIRTGLAVLTDYLPGLDAVIFMVCDQPFVTTELLEHLVDAATCNDKGMVVSRYAGAHGVPALFKSKYFEDLRNLQGDTGGGQLFARYAGDLLFVDFDNGDIDIDTPQDYDKLQAR